MKSIKSYLIIIALIIITLPCCEKDDMSPVLVIRLVDLWGEPVIGAEVKLYSSYTDMANQNEEEQVGSTLTSGADGSVTFSNLKMEKYYWFAEKGCLNNFYDIVTTNGILEADKRRIITSYMIQTGNLKLTNQSQDEYEVYINGELLGNISGTSPSYTYIIPEGTYSINVIQVGGSINKTYTGTIACNSTWSVTFP